MPRRKDIWRCGVVLKPVDQLLASGWDGAPVHWLDEQPPFCFLADPFGWREHGLVHLFVERYDYRSRHGVIDKLAFNDQWQMVDARCVLHEPWHLSYPLVFEGEGARWMLPEAHRSGALTLYRGADDLVSWQPAHRIQLDCIPVDATPLWHDGRWWLFYSPATSAYTKVAHLHVAYASTLTGPWIAHPGNPVRVNRSSARPGGVPVLVDDRIMLPVQDCTRTYGGAIRPLWINHLDEVSFDAEAGAALSLPPTAGRYSAGMHTLSGCGPFTLIDVKRIDRSARGMWLDIRRALRRYAG